MAYIVATVNGERKALSVEGKWILQGEFLAFQNRIEARRFITDNFLALLDSGAVTGITVREKSVC